MKYLLTAILFLALLAGAFLAGTWYRQGETASVHSPEAKSPSVSTHAKHDTVAETEMDPSALPPGTVRIPPDKQQMVGVRTGVVEKAAVEHFIRTVGRVAPDEKRVYRLVAGNRRLDQGDLQQRHRHFRQEGRAAGLLLQPPVSHDPDQLLYPSLVHHRTSAMTLAEGKRSRPPSWQPSISRPMSTRWKASA